VDIGDVVAEKYEVRRVLEVGGRSTLLEAIELGQERFVVVELFRPFRVSQAHERFERELRCVSGLKSTHLGRVFESGAQPDGSHYVIAEPQEGDSLETLLRRQGPMQLVRVVDLILQACEGMAEAHGAQVVHEDLSPETLFWTRLADGSGAIKIRDFGARLAAFAITEGRMFGAPRYTAPEQLPQSSGVDPRTDIWALGAIMYELSTGHRPFEQPESQLERALHSSEPPPLCTLRPGLPLTFSDAVMRCLARSPSARFSSVAELAAAIAPFGSVRGQTVAGAVRGALAAGASRLRESTDMVRQLVRARRP
jgi:serine/threonine-protein kinase